MSLKKKPDDGLISRNMLPTVFYSVLYEVYGDFEETDLYTEISLYAKWPATCFGQPHGHLQGR